MKRLIAWIALWLAVLCAGCGKEPVCYEAPGGNAALQISTEQDSTFCMAAFALERKGKTEPLYDYVIRDCYDASHNWEFVPEWQEGRVVISYRENDAAWESITLEFAAS